MLEFMKRPYTNTDKLVEKEVCNFEYIDLWVKVSKDKFLKFIENMLFDSDNVDTLKIHNIVSELLEKDIEYNKSLFSKRSNKLDYIKNIGFELQDGNIEYLKNNESFKHIYDFYINMKNIKGNRHIIIGLKPLYSLKLGLLLPEFNSDSRSIVYRFHKKYINIDSNDFNHLHIEFDTKNIVSNYNECTSNLGDPLLGNKCVYVLSSKSWEYIENQLNSFTIIKEEQL